MKGLLVYTTKDAQVNSWFINHLIEEVKKFGAELSLVLCDDADDFDAKPFENFDFCINRSRFTLINHKLDLLGMPCFNNEKTIEVANDKYKTYELCKSLGVPVMETCLFTNEGAANIEYPCVLKSVSGHGGKEVFWLDGIEDLQSLTLFSDTEYILQKTCSHTGVDVRVYVLGGDIIAGIKRSSSESFRSNFTLGGKAEVFDVTKEQKKIVSLLQKELKTDYAGFDFIFHNGEWVLNEIEDAVGARMLYSLCDFDIAQLFAEYVITSVKKGSF